MRVFFNWLISKRTQLPFEFVPSVWVRIMVTLCLGTEQDHGSESDFIPMDPTPNRELTKDSFVMAVDHLDNFSWMTFSWMTFSYDTRTPG